MLVNEADVVRAAGQQLINPVNIVLQDIHRLGIKVLCNSEVARRLETATVRKEDAKTNTHLTCYGLSAQTTQVSKRGRQPATKKATKATGKSARKTSSQFSNSRTPVFFSGMTSNTPAIRRTKWIICWQNTRKSNRG